MKKRMLYFALAIALVLALLPMETQASSTGDSISGDVTWNAGDVISSAVSISGDTNITVNGTVTMNAGISITGGQVILSGGGTLLRADTGFHMIEISGGSLTLDSITLDGGKVENTGLGINAQNCTVTMNSGCRIQNHWRPSAGKGAAISLGSGANFTMNGGEISDCRSQQYGGAVYIGDNSTFIMNGGKVQNNQTLLADASYGGGAFYVRKATLTINGGSISGNSSAVGGAIYNSSYGTTIINGGSISGNSVSGNSSAVGGAIYHSCKERADSVLKLSGDANIATDNDIYLSSSDTSGAKYLEITSALRNALKLTIVEPGDGRLVAQGSGYALTLNDMAKLQTGNTGFVLNLNGSNQIILATTAAEYPVYLGYDANGGVDEPAGESAELSLANPSATVLISSVAPSRNKYSFLGWATDKDAATAVYRAGDEFTLNGNATLYAVWEEAIPDAPPAVTLSARADSYIEVSNIRAGCEYVITTDSTAPDSWPTGGTNYYQAAADGTYRFTGLSANTQYSIFGRVAETAETNVSPSSAALSVTTKSALSGVSVSMSGYTYGGTPSTPSLSGYSGSGVTYYYGTANQNTGGAKWESMTATPLNAGTYYMYATIDETDNRVAFTTPAAAFTVSPVTLTPSVASVTGREYTGNTDATGTLSLSGALDGQSPTATGTFTWVSANAGTTNVNVTNITLDDAWATNYTLSATSLSSITAPGNAKISPKALNITAQTVTYNGTMSHTVENYPTGIGSEKITLTYTPTAKDAGDYTRGESSNGFTLTLPAGNYAVQSAGTLTIEQKALTAPVKTVTYDGGTSFTQQVDGINDEKVTITYTANSKNTGSYRFSATAAGGSYTAAVSGTNYHVADGEMLTIEPLTAVLTWSGDGESTYNGSARSVTAAVSNVMKDDVVSVTVSGGAETNARATAYTATATGLTGEDGKNYDLSANSGTTYTIIPKSISGGTVTLGDALTYSGAQQIQTVSGVSIDGLTATYTISNNAQTAAGTYTLTVTGTGNFTGTQTENFTIAQKAVTLTWNYTEPYTFNGKARSVTATVSNKVGLDAFTLTYADNSQTAAGSYIAEVTALGNSNYTLTNATGTTQSWVIQKAPVSFAVTDNSCVYNNTPHTATVTQTAEQLPAIGSGFTVAYQKGGETATASKTDAGSYDIIVTLTDANFRLNGQADDVRSFKVGTLTIGKKSIAAQWKNLSHVYDGDTQTPTFDFTGADIEPGDSENVRATLSGDQSRSAAGTYTVRATLTGDRAHNYELTNPTGSLIIQRAPVTFTVSSNSAAHDGSPHFATVTATANGKPFADFTLSYRNAKGERVDKPTDAGSYDIYAEISNTNYRHAGAADGAARKIGVLRVYRAAQPQTYTLSFAGGKNATGSVNALPAALSGTPRVLPGCDFAVTGKTFTGWEYGGRSYRPGEQLTQPAANITLAAQWAENVYDIAGAVNQAGKPLADVVVTLMLGSEQIDQTTTDASGTYRFSNVLPGLYNLVASINGISKTILMEIVAENAENQNITMPSGKTSSVVEVAAGSPPIVVGNLEQTFDSIENNPCYDETDQTVVTDGGTVEIKLTAEAVTESESEAAIESKSDGTVGLLLDVTLSKTVIRADGTTDRDASGELEESPMLLQIVINLPGELQRKDSYTVYRAHGGEVHTLTATPNAAGEYIAVNAERTAITVYAKFFSSYAVAYKTNSYVGRNGNQPVVLPTTHGAVTLAPTTPAYGAAVTITATPDAGYQLGSLAATDSSGKPVTLTKQPDGTFTFTQPRGAVTVQASFRPVGGLPFTDVAESSRFYDDVAYVYENGLMQGTSGTTFSPYRTTTRGMIVTILYRLAGKPAVSGSCPFEDVKSGRYYENAVTWAAANGIVEGYGNGRFGPDDPITRQQMAAILYRYAAHKGYDVSAAADLSGFSDAGSISDYARTALCWANAEALINGKSGNILDPMSEASRAQVAAILHRFCENVAR